jgi:hypothetical protein
VREEQTDDGALASDMVVLIGEGNPPASYSGLNPVPGPIT